jgi:preprotein translocase subunit SecA
LLVSALADTLQEGEDYSVTLQSQSITLLPSARERLASQAEPLADLWRPAPRREELLRQALMVRHFHKPGQHYVVQDGEVVLLDEFTGRMTPGRTLTAGLHQAIEAREGLTITAPNESLAQMSFQAFFRCFRKLSGSTGTAWEAASELWRVYGLQVVRIPTHRPRQTIYHAPVLVEQSDHKWAAVVQEVLAERAKGRPVLVGVRSITSSQLLAEHLQAAQCPVSVLNALAHAQEADIVAQAGAPSRVTIATNMAGRGTDIGLGEGVAEAGGLHVIVAESNDSARIDRQLAGRCGRQGDPGSVSVYLCLADELVQRLMSQGLRRLVLAVSSRRGAGHQRLARPSPSSRVAAWAFRRVQKRAERQAFLRRWSVLRSDDWMASALPFGGRRKGGPA